MTEKSASVASVAVIVAAGLSAAWWWTSRPTSGPSLADYTPSAPYVRQDLPATRPAGRMSLPWAAPSANSSPPGLVDDGGRPAALKASPATPRPAAALPWGARPRVERGPVAAADVPRTGPPSVLSVPEAANNLSFSRAVVTWLREWEAGVRTGRPKASSVAAEFASILDRDDASIESLLSLMRATQQLEDHPRDRHAEAYPSVTGVIASRIVFLGADKADHDPQRRFLVMRQIAALIERLRCGGDAQLSAAARFYESLTRQEPTGAPDWVRGNLGRAEVLGRLCRYDDALAGLDRIDSAVPNADANLAAKLRFTRGHLLYGAGRAAQAIPHLRAASDVAAFVERRDARCLLMQASASVGDVKATASVLREYVRDYDVPALQAQAMADELRTEIVRFKQLNSKG